MSHVSCATAVITKCADERPAVRRSTAPWGRPTSDPSKAGVEAGIFGCDVEGVEWPDPQPPINSAPALAISEYVALSTRRTLPTRPKLPLGVAPCCAAATTRSAYPPSPNHPSRREICEAAVRSMYRWRATK